MIATEDERKFSGIQNFFNFDCDLFYVADRTALAIVTFVYIARMRDAAQLGVFDRPVRDKPREAEQLLDEGSRYTAALIHLADEWADFAVRELVNAVAKQPFVFGKARQSGLRHATDVNRAAFAKATVAGETS